MAVDQGVAWLPAPFRAYLKSSEDDDIFSHVGIQNEIQMREVCLYGCCTATLHLRRFGRTTRRPMCAQKSGQLKCLTDHETCRHHRWCAHYTKSSSDTSASSVYSALWWKQIWWKNTASVMCSKMPFKDWCLLFQQLQVFHCIFVCVQDNAKRLQWEKGATNCVPRQCRYVPRLTLKWTVCEISPDSVIYIEGCACGMGNFVCQ